jgi:transcriptional regulator with XRE-family HTH domain
MSLAETLRRLRRERQLTQLQVASRAGLTVSYLSRLETGKIQPTVVTVGRLATALEVAVADLFRPDADRPAPAHRCPVSHSGTCIGRLIREHDGAPAGASRARYGVEELRLLRLADYLVLHGPPRVRAALGTVLEALMAQATSGRRRRDHGGG